MEAFAIIMVLASLIAGIYGLINWAKPLGFLKITKRWQGAAVFGGAFISFWVFAFIGAASQPGGLSASTPNEQQAETQSSAAVESPAKKDGVTQEEFNAVWNRVKNEMERCDAPLRRAGNAIGTGDVYTAFGPVKAASEACETAWLDMGRIDIPKSAKGDAKKAIKEALDTCNTAIYLKRESMKQLQTVLDGDVRPSVMADLKDKMDRGAGLTTRCTYEFLAAASKSDLVLPEVQEAIDKAGK